MGDEPTPVARLVEQAAQLAERAEVVPDDGTPAPEPLTRSAWLAQRWASAIPAEFADARLGDLEPAVAEELSAWADEPDGRNLLLVGPVGVGKTHAAVAAAWPLHQAGHEVELWPVVEMFARLRPGGPEHELERLMRVDLLVVDDIAAERSTEYQAENLYALLNRRRGDRRPTVATSNLDPAGGRSLYDALGERTWSRLVGGAVVVALSGRDRRRSG